MAQVVLYSDDITLISYWEKVFIDAKSYDSIEMLLQSTNSVVVVNYSSLGINIRLVIDELLKQGNTLLVLDRTPSLQTARSLLAQGVLGYGNALMKESFLSHALETITEGYVWLHPELTSALVMQIPPHNSLDEKIQKLEKLSKREVEVAELLCDGYTYKDIAQKLAITPRTVKAHATNIYTKLHLKDRLELALYLK